MDPAHARSLWLSGLSHTDTTVRSVNTDTTTDSSFHLFTLTLTITLNLTLSLSLTLTPTPTLTRTRTRTLTRYDELTASGELCDSARKGKVEHVKMLLKCGADVNAADYDLRTCAHLAASEGNMYIIEVLVACESINLSVVDRFGSTPLSDALRGGHLEVARFLVTQGGKVVYDDLTASGELCEFARSGKLERIQLLLEGGCNVDACDYDGRTCLHLAASTGNMLVVQGLLTAGANLSPVDGFGVLCQA